MTLSDEQIQNLLRIGNPTDEECRLIRMGWDAAMRTQGIPDGYKLMPIEPTTGMICEMERQWMCGSQIDMAKREWKATCAAAPSQEKGNGGI